MPFFLFVRAWKTKYDLLGSLSSGLMQDRTLTARKGKKIPITGITICGGEPFYQTDNLVRFVKELKKLHPFKIWIMTGFLWEDLIRYEAPYELLKLTDYIIDGSFMLDKMNLAHPFAGSTNQRVINVQKSIRIKKVSLWSPRYRWMRLFNEYWRKFSNPKSIEKYKPFLNAQEAMIYLRKEKIINKITTIKEYEKHFGQARKNFIKRILG
jgi:organic radical activating enzyme